MKEALFAARVTRRLDESADDLPPRVRQRLSAARTMAMERAAQATRRTAAHPLLAGGPSAGRTPALRPTRSGQPRIWWRLTAAGVPLVIVLAGLISISYWDDNIKAEELADTDTAVLTDVDLPLTTLADRGFGVFLANSRQ